MVVKPPSLLCPEAYRERVLMMTPTLLGIREGYSPRACAERHSRDMDFMHSDFQSHLLSITLMKGHYVIS